MLPGSPPCPGLSPPPSAPFLCFCEASGPETHCGSFCDWTSTVPTVGTEMAMPGGRTLEKTRRDGGLSPCMAWEARGPFSVRLQGSVHMEPSCRAGHRVHKSRSKCCLGTPSAGDLHPTPDPCMQSAHVLDSRLGRCLKGGRGEELRAACAREEQLCEGGPGVEGGPRRK